MNEDAIVARVLREVAKVLEAAYVPGGYDSHEEFIAPSADDLLEQAARDLKARADQIHPPPTTDA